MDMQIPVGTTIESNITGPIKTVKNYAKTKVALKKYESKTGVIPFHKLKRKMFKNNGKTTDLNKQIGNPLTQLMYKCAADTTDVYFNGETPVVSCSYQLEQGFINKRTRIVCNCIDTQAKTHQAYYYLSMCMKYNISTQDTESMLNRLLSTTG